MTDILLSEISAKLSCMIALLMQDSNSSQNLTARQKATMLKQYQLSNSDIANIIGSTERSVQEMTRKSRATKAIATRKST